MCFVTGVGFVWWFVVAFCWFYIVSMMCVLKFLLVWGCCSYLFSLSGCDFCDFA